MAEKVISVFIRDDAVNLLLVEGRLVKKWASLPLEAGLVRQGLVMDETKVAGELDKLFKRAKIMTRRVVAGISGFNSLYRLISLPELPEEILPEAVKQEARRVIPVPLEEVYLAYQRLPAPPGETRIFLAAFPRNVADVLVRTMRLAGIQPYVMDLAPLALCRTLDEPRAIIINAMLDHLDVMIMDDRLPQLIHRLSLPGEVTSVEEKITAITEEVNRTVDFYNSSHRENPLSATVPMYVCSDLVEVPDNWQSLGSKLGCPVSILPSPVESPDGFDANEFMVNIGLVLKEMQPEREGANFSLVNFNALPEVYQPKALSLSSIISRVAVIAGIGLVILLGFLVHSRSDYISLLRSQLAPIQAGVTQQIKGIGDAQAQIKQIEAQLGPLAARAAIFDNTLTSLKAGREGVSGDLTEVVNLAPGTVTLTGIVREGNAIRITGTASSEDDIFFYARDLMDSFGDVTISSMQAQEAGGFIRGFNFVLTIEKG
jgi:type IV pilus assembly protein PilM